MNLHIYVRRIGLRCLRFQFYCIRRRIPPLFFTPVAAVSSEWRGLPKSADSLHLDKHSPAPEGKKQQTHVYPHLTAASGKLDNPNCPRHPLIGGGCSRGSLAVISIKFQPLAWLREPLTPTQVSYSSAKLSCIGSCTHRCHPPLPLENNLFSAASVSLCHLQVCSNTNCSPVVQHFFF